MVKPALFRLVRIEDRKLFYHDIADVWKSEKDGESEYLGFTLPENDEIKILRCTNLLAPSKDDKESKSSHWLYEGDIIEGILRYTETNVIYKGVIWFGNDGAFELHTTIPTSPCLYLNIIYYPKYLGNIFDNPELLNNHKYLLEF